MRSKLKHRSLTLMLLTMAGMISGCSNFHNNINELNHFSNISSIKKSHPLVQHDLTVLYATLYFIRPKTEHAQGFADAPLKISVDGKKLMSLAKAEYTLLYIKPRSVDITMSNKTQTRGRWEVEEMKTTRHFDFKAGETYFILAQPIDGEFRGTRFVPTALNTAEAKRASRYLSPVGKALKNQIVDI